MGSDDYMPVGVHKDESHFAEWGLAPKRVQDRCLAAEIVAEANENTMRQWEAEAKRLRESERMWRSVANRWRCCEAGIVAAPDRCPWHGNGTRDQIHDHTP